MIDLTTALPPAELRSRFEQFNDPAINVTGASIICTEDRDIPEALGREDAVKLVADEILMFCAAGSEYTRIIHLDGTEELHLEGDIHIQVSDRGEQRSDAAARLCNPEMA